MQKEHSDTLRRKALENATFNQYVKQVTPNNKSLCAQKIKQLKNQIRVQGDHLQKQIVSLRAQLKQCNEHNAMWIKQNEDLHAKMQKIHNKQLALIRKNEVLKAMARERSHEGGLGW
jgi:hypothetical protein